MAVFLRPSRSVLRIAEGAAAARVANHPERRPPPHGVNEDAAGCAEELERLTKLHTVGALSDAEFGAAKSRLRASDRRRMASNATRASVLLKAIEASVAGDSSVVAELYTKDVHGWTPATSVSSAAELAVEIEDRETAFSEVDLDLTALDVCGDQACVEWVATATLSGPLVADDHLIEPTGRRVTLRGVTIADFDGEKICAFRQYADEVALLDHLGILADD